MDDEERKEGMYAARSYYYKIIDWCLHGTAGRQRNSSSKLMGETLFSNIKF